VEADDVVAEARAAAVEELSPAGEGAQHARHVIGRAPHEPEGGLRPQPVHASAPPEILGRARHQPHGAVPAAAGGVDVRRGFLDIGRAGQIEGLGHAPDGLGEGRMLGHVVHPLAVEEHGPAVPEAREIVIAAAHPGLLGAATLPHPPPDDKPPAPVIRSRPS
jgi:hypothetical protein